MVQIYWKQIQYLLKQTDQHNYEEAMDYLAKVKKLMESMGKIQEFPSIIAEIRSKHRRKRSLTALLDRKEWL